MSEDPKLKTPEEIGILLAQAVSASDQAALAHEVAVEKLQAAIVLWDQYHVALGTFNEAMRRYEAYRQCHIGQMADAIAPALNIKDDGR